MTRFTNSLTIRSLTVAALLLCGLCASAVDLRAQCSGVGRAQCLPQIFGGMGTKGPFTAGSILFQGSQENITEDNLYFRYSSSAHAVSLYGGATLVGQGLPSFVGQASSVGFHAAISTANILASTITSTARYRVSYYMLQLTSGSGGTCATNATATVTLGWTDPGIAQTMAKTALNLTPTLAAGAYQTDTLYVVSAASHAITYAVGWSNGNCTTQPTASIYLTVERAN